MLPNSRVAWKCTKHRVNIYKDLPVPVPIYAFSKQNINGT